MSPITSNQMTSALALILITAITALGVVLLAAGVVRMRRARPAQDSLAVSLVRISVGVAVSALVLMILTL
jgi:hypothetical protein